jgi:hypothetical protein
MKMELEVTRGRKLLCSEDKGRYGLSRRERTAYQVMGL